MESKSNSKPVGKSALSTVSAIVLTAIIVGSVVGGAASYFSTSRADAIVAEIKSQNEKTSSEIANVQSGNAQLKVDLIALQDENGKLKSQVSAVSSDLRAVADAAGIPINNPDEMKKLMEERKVIEAAKKEGELVLYTVTDARTFTAFRSAFERKYPFITVENIGGGAAVLVKRFLDEHEKGVKSADVLVLSQSNHREILAKGELYAKYAPKDSGWLAPEQRDPEWRWGSAVTPWSIGYNTKLVPKDQAPKSFKDLVDPKWKGKLASNDPKINPLYVDFYRALEKEYGEEFVRQLAAQNIRNVNPAVAWDKLAAGEFAVLVNGVIPFAEPRKAAGQPVDWVRTSDSVYLQTLGGNAISANAPHPNAARLWVDFWMSKEGQQIIADAGSTAPRPGIRLPNPDTAMQGKKLILMEPLSEAEQKAFLAKYPVLAP